MQRAWYARVNQECAEILYIGFEADRVESRAKLNKFGWIFRAYKSLGTLSLSEIRLVEANARNAEFANKTTILIS